MGVDALSIALKSCTYVAVLQSAGIALFLVLFGDALTATRKALLGLGLAFALGGIASLLLFQLFEAARMAGELPGVFDGSLQALALHSRMGAANIARLAGLAILAIAFRMRRPAGAAFLLLGVAITTSSFLWAGHTSTHPWRWTLAPLLWGHVSIVAFWFGALLPLGLTCQHEVASISQGIVQRFSRLATWLVPLIAIAGVALGLGLAGPRLYDTPYGRMLIAKLAAFAVLMGLAALNRWRLGPAVGSGPAAVRTFRRSIWTEYALIGAVIVLTAALTSLYSPGD